MQRNEIFVNNNLRRKGSSSRQGYTLTKNHTYDMLQWEQTFRKSKIYLHFSVLHCRLLYPDIYFPEICGSVFGKMMVVEGDQKNMILFCALVSSITYHVKGIPPDVSLVSKKMCRRMRATINI